MYIDLDHASTLHKIVPVKICQVNINFQGHIQKHWNLIFIVFKNTILDEI
jgi:hypothetical protein